ncbi:hypothetical protein CR513_07045, partial [Mucuna pruriens]
MPPNSYTLFHTFVTPSSSYSSVLAPETLQISTREVVEERLDGEEYVYPQNVIVLGDEEWKGKLGRACEVYVCNLPRSCDAADLRPYETILSVELQALNHGL